MSSVTRNIQNYKKAKSRQKMKKEKLTVPPRPPREMLLKRWPSAIVTLLREPQEREREGAKTLEIF